MTDERRDNHVDKRKVIKDRESNFADRDNTGVKIDQFMKDHEGEISNEMLRLILLNGLILAVPAVLIAVSYWVNISRH